jgi:uncharacterized tellurite resistance protein B-like protein
MTMRTYVQNSPAAMARVLAMMIVTDAHIDEREIRILDRLDVYSLLGISRNEFMTVARDYCADLGAEAELEGSTPMLDPDRADRVIDCVDVRDRRLLVAKLLIAILAADGVHAANERVLFAHTLDRWSLKLEDVVGLVTKST